MNTSQLYKYATWLLLALNLLLIAFFLTKPGPPGGKGKRMFRNQAIEILRLDTEQEAAFLKLAKNHREEMNKLNEQGNGLLKKYFSPLLDSTMVVDQAQLLSGLLALEKAKIEGTYQHFLEVKNTLDDSQIDDFDVFMSRAIGILLVEDQNRPLLPKD